MRRTAAASSLAGLLARTVSGPGSCLLWQGSRARGYGNVRFRSQTCYAHRVAYQLALGPIPVLGTAAENAQDMERKGRGTRSILSLTQSAPRLHGEANPQAKLTAEQVRAIRERYVPRLVSMKSLADEYGVNATTIFYAVHQVTWSSTGRLDG